MMVIGDTYSIQPVLKFDFDEFLLIRFNDFPHIVHKKLHSFPYSSTS